MYDKMSGALFFFVVFFFFLLESIPWFGFVRSTLHGSYLFFLSDLHSIFRIFASLHLSWITASIAVHRHFGKQVFFLEREGEKVSIVTMHYFCVWPSMIIPS